LQLDRRLFLKASGLLALSGMAGCATTNTKTSQTVADTEYAPEMAAYEVMYAARPDEQFPLPAIPYHRIDRKYLRQWVDNPTGERPGTVVVDVGNHFLYFTYANGKAMRYGVGLGRAGFAWAGEGIIQYKRQWPRWTPPDEMVKRQPELERYSIANGGMDAGLRNPLGARALYIFQNNEDTLYRIHGSPEWNTIGRSVSSGCVRMLNQDVIDLYGRVPGKTRIVVTNLGSLV
jgi:lipoprotein-anchoring transpeptidase ErfK/SrfK